MVLQRMATEDGHSVGCCDFGQNFELYFMIPKFICQTEAQRRLELKSISHVLSYRIRSHLFRRFIVLESETEHMHKCRVTFLFAT